MKKTKILILHGWEGSPSPHWQDWLARELVSAGFAVYFPQLPYAGTPRKKVWLECLDEIMGIFSPNIVVCHSLGCVLWLHYAAKHPNAAAVEKLFLVAPPSNETNVKSIDTFFPYPAPKLSSKENLLVASTDDPYLTVQQAELICEKTGCALAKLQKAGHINTASGFGEWEWMLETIVK